MRIIEQGHIYALETKEGNEQLLTFVKSLPEDSSSNHDGVLCQEVIRALIDRVLDLNSQVPCHENIDIIERLRECLILFERRAFSRTLAKSYAKTGLNVEELPTQKNGHFFSLEE